MIDHAMSDSTSLSIVVILVSGTVDLFEFRASYDGLLDSTLHSHLTGMNEVLQHTVGRRPSQFITGKVQKDCTIFSKKVIGS
jgi:hypothetical protein